MAGDAKNGSEKKRIEDKIKSGANWFFWIAGAFKANKMLREGATFFAV